MTRHDQICSMIINLRVNIINYCFYEYNGLNSQAVSYSIELSSNAIKYHSPVTTYHLSNTLRLGYS